MKASKMTTNKIKRILQVHDGIVLLSIKVISNDFVLFLLFLEGIGNILDVCFFKSGCKINSEKSEEKSQIRKYL